MSGTQQNTRVSLRNLGLRGRLLLAFFGISAFAVFAAVAAMSSFFAVGGALDLIAEKRVPPALDALEISRQAERIVAGAPALLAAKTMDQRETQSQSILVQVERLETLLSDLRSTTVDADALEELETAAKKLRDNLDAVDTLVAGNLALGARKKELIREAIAANNAIQRLLTPWVQVTESRIQQLRGVIDDGTAPSEHSGALVDHIGANDARERLQQAQLEASMISDKLLQAASAEQPDQLTVAEFRLRRRVEGLAKLTSGFDEKLQALMTVQLDAFGGLVEGEQSITGLRGEELALQQAGRDLLGQNVELVAQLTVAVDDLVGSAKGDIATARADARSVQRFSTGLLIAIVVLSLGSSILIVWLYVGRNVVARITALSRSMLAIAEGDLHTDLPAAAGDEVGQMAQALHVFRDAAVVRGVFGKYVPKGVAEAIIANRGSLEPVQTMATILYSDLESFTGMAEGMSPREVVAMLNEYFPAVIEPINRHGGIVNQFQGDAMLVTFNVPIEDPHHADQAVRAAREIQEVVGGRNFLGRSLRTRIGITTGTVIAGNVGSGDRMNYTVHGDAVNLAARLEQLNKEYGTQVLVSAVTVSLLADSYPLEPIGEVDIRGKNRSVAVFKLAV